MIKITRVAYFVHLSIKKVINITEWSLLQQSSWNVMLKYNKTFITIYNEYLISTKNLGVQHNQVIKKEKSDSIY